MIKDHKVNFKDNPIYRLIISTKSKLRKISKITLEEINSELRTTLRLNHWKTYNIKQLYTHTIRY